MYKIGELSKICNLSVKALRYYDDEGLLIPEFVDKYTGYRYYSGKQLNNCYQIIAMKELGFNLSEIKKQLNAKDSSEVYSLICEKERELKSLQEQTEERLQKLSVIKNNITKERKEMFKVFVQQLESFRIACFRAIFPSKKDAFRKLKEMRGEIPNNILGKRDIIINYETEFCEEDFDLQIGVEITGTLPNGFRYQEEMVDFQNKMATVVCDIKGINEAYSEMIKYTKENNYQIIGAFFEIYHDDTTVEMKVPVWLLNSNENNHNDDLNINFENDDRVIGKWEYVDCLPSFKQFNPSKIKNSSKPFLKEIYFLPNGENYWYLGWTKGYLLTKTGYPYNQYKNRYDIQNINGIDYLFVEIKIHEYESRGGKPLIYIYKKVSNEIFKKEEIRIYDFTDFPFKVDKDVLGEWDAIDFIEPQGLESNKFNPKYQYFPKEELYFLHVEFKENGDCINTFNNAKFPQVKINWTKGMLLNHYHQIAEHYLIKNIDNEDYLFIEWKSGDYQFGGLEPNYYVFKRKI